MKIKQNKKKQLNFKEQKYILQNLVNSNVKKIKEIYRKVQEMESMMCLGATSQDQCRTNTGSTGQAGASSRRKGERQIMMLPQGIMLRADDKKKRSSFH